MTPGTPDEMVLAVAVLFARIGGLFLIAPGLSHSRVPVRIRVFLALGITLALTPLLLEDLVAVVAERTPAELVRVIGTETIIGLMIGLLARLLFMALQTLAVAIANFVGLGAIPGISVDNDEPSLAVANILTSAALVVMFLADLHYEVLRAAIGSYAVLAPGGGLDPRAALMAVADRFGEAFLVALRLAAPFLIYSVIVNFAVGLTNKLTPQLPVFFVALPMVVAGGLIMMVIAIREVLTAFLDAFARLTVGL